MLLPHMHHLAVWRDVVFFRDQNTLTFRKREREHSEREHPHDPEDVERKPRDV